MATTTANQKAYALLAYYKKVYKEKYGVLPKTNQFADKWGFVDVLADMSKDEAEGLLDFYMRTTSPSGHSLQWFFYHYHELVRSKQETEDDAAARAKLRAETKQRVEEYRKRYGDNGSTTD